MPLKQVALASASALFLLAACGGTETAEETPQADGPIESEASLTEDPEVGLDEAPATGADAMAGNTTLAEEDPAVPPLLDEMEGEWVSADDEASGMSILDGTVTMLYDGEVISTETIDVAQSCADAPGDTSGLDLITMTGTDGESLCYGVIALDDDRLELTSYPRGNTLTYTRQVTPVDPEGE